MRTVIKCRNCGKTIQTGSLRYVMGLLDDPHFCSRECGRRWITENRQKVDDYLMSVFVTATRES